MKQSEAFEKGEGDRWLERNREKMVRPDDDLLLQVIEEAGIKPTRVLEVGCSNGWRLNEIQKRYGAMCVGIEPSWAAVTEARAKYPGVWVGQGHAHDLEYWDNPEFDLVLYGFCLYVVDRSDLLQVAAEGSRVLREGGFIGILDFKTDVSPHSRVYHHAPELRTYKMNYRNLWTASQTFHHVRWKCDEENIADLIRKDTQALFPLAVGGEKGAF